LYLITQRLYLSLIVLFIGGQAVSGQSFYSNGTATTVWQDSVVYDSITVSGLNQPTLNGNFGLDSVTLNLNSFWSCNLIVSLISPDGTIVHLSERNGGTNGSNYAGSNFNMNATYIVSELQSPFTGSMVPDNSIANFNNGQNGNDIWRLKVQDLYMTGGVQVVNFGLHFNNTPETPILKESKLPIVVVNTNYVTMSFLYWASDYKAKIPGTMGVIYNGPGLINHVTDSFNHFTGNIKINVRGNTSVGYSQKSYSVDTKGNDGITDTSVGLLGMPEEEDWILYAPACDKAMIRNVFAYQLWGETGKYTPRTRFCELILNGDYKGVYVLQENIKRGSNRVAVNKMDEDDTTGNDLTGGYILQINPGCTDTTCFESNLPPCQGSQATINYNYEYPKPQNINDAQKEYISAYVDSFEQALAHIDYADTEHGYRHFIDVPSFIDFAIMQELGNNVDAYRISTHLYKPRNGKLFAGPIWDFNLAYCNSYEVGSWSTHNFRWDEPCPSNINFLAPFWWRAFLQDETFVRELRCRYSELRSGPLSIGHISHLLDSLYEILEIPQTRNFERWPILGRFIIPNVYIGQTWEDEMSHMKNWIYERIAFLDKSWYEPYCALNTEDPDNSSPIITLYPNPATEQINIASVQKLNGVMIYNAMGQLIYKNIQTATKYKIDVQYWPAGIYTLEIRMEQGMKREKITIL
jgi:hypothetical protein